MSFDAAVLSAPLPDASASPIASFELFYTGAEQQPRSCPSAHWEFAPPEAQGTVTSLRNTGGVVIAYIAETDWEQGVHYIPGVPTGVTGEAVGVLAPGASVNLTADEANWVGAENGPHANDLSGDIVLLGAAKPFSDDPGGFSEFAASDEGTIPWPQGVANATGATTMNVAQVTGDVPCQAVVQAW